jgi:hypothetical protein
MKVTCTRKYYSHVVCSAAHGLVTCTLRLLLILICSNLEPGYVGLTWASNVFLLMLSYRDWFDDNCDAFTATLWCLWTTYAYKWSVGVDSGSRDISISKISARSCKLRSARAECIVMLMKNHCSDDVYNILLIESTDLNNFLVCWYWTCHHILWFAHLCSNISLPCFPHCLKFLGLCWCSAACYWRCP